MVPGSTLMYGSSLSRVTLIPRASSRAPSEAEAIPFPSDETTPPVMNIKRVPLDVVINISGGIRLSVRRNRYRGERGPAGVSYQGLDAIRLCPASPWEVFCIPDFP